ncbi:ABC transporter ATP-binding protein/permease [Terrarubrum flagellatum]|uniref:ABC transporter ATP-binding protein/permease n=1 Tax=Terrirubrum flagellatum TaxID=2895980 RepID=UPI0031451B3D
MQVFALVTAALSGLFMLVAPGESAALPIYVPISGFAMAALLYLSRDISSFLRIFVVMYALGYLFLAGMSTLGALGWLPNAINDLMPPAFMATASVAFAAIVYGVSFIPVIRTIMSLADPYFSATTSPVAAYGFFGRLFSTEGRAAAAMVGVIIAGNFVQVALTVRLNAWYRDLFDALQKKDASAFWYQIWWVFVPLLVVWIIFQMIDLITDTIFDIRWRTWMTQSYYGRWLSRGTHYKMQMVGAQTDNPDQRIAVDVRAFIQSTMTLSIRLLSQLATLVSFTVVLWTISSGFTFPGTDYVIPGFLVWVALIYAVIGTLFTHLIGKPLIGLDFKQEQVEANFRFSLARLREYGEQVALLRGADTEKSRLTTSFGAIIRNYIEILKRRMKLTGFTFSWTQMSVAFPYIFMGQYFFLGKITLGQLQQGSSAFSRVDSAMSFFINAYATLASYKAGIDRLTSFNDSMTRAEQANTKPPHIDDVTVERDVVAIPELDLALPQGRTIAHVDGLALKSGERTLLTGPSGSGKSTLFRAIAGIWPFGKGRIETPADKSVMLLPQRPYIPQGALRSAIAYPADEHAYSDDAIRDALGKVKLAHLESELDRDDQWQQRLSGGEQQRLAIARALLAKPDWLFLDEATASLDEPLEAEIYAAIRKTLPNTTIVSIGHRSTLAEMHDRKLTMSPGADGVFKPVDAKEKADA